MRQRTATNNFLILPMQFRLSTIFLVFFNVAASLAVFEEWGILVSVIMLLAALSINRAKTVEMGILFAFLIVFAGLSCAGLLTPAVARSPEAARRAACMNNLERIGDALNSYHKTNGHFPMPYTIDRNGKPLFSWRVEILQMFHNELNLNAYNKLYRSLKKDDPWNSAENTEYLNKIPIMEYICPSAYRNKNDYFTSNYIALIGPETAWNTDKPVKLSDLPDGGSHTVMVIEVVNSGIHWAEPRDLTIKEALERMKSGEGLRMSAGHPTIVDVLFADGSVKCMPKSISISDWKKIFNGDVKDIDKLVEDQGDSEVPDLNVAKLDGEHMPFGKLDDKSEVWKVAFGFIIWLFSVVLLFRHAIKSRRKPAPTT
jgi:hypothetical protein